MNYNGSERVKGVVSQSRNRILRFSGQHPIPQQKDGSARAPQCSNPNMHAPSVDPLTLDQARAGSAGGETSPWMPPAQFYAPNEINPMISPDGDVVSGYDQYPDSQ
jgi:hypothetical protein